LSYWYQRTEKVNARKMNLRLVGLCQLDEMRVGFLLGGVIGERDLVRVAADGEHG
jgi:hypothetical protein